MSDGGAGSASSASGSEDGVYSAKDLHVCDPAIAAISAWLVLVITLEVNDFRHHLHLSHRAQANETSIPHHRYIASLVAVRLGLRDALVDVSLLYSLTYAIVIGCTYGDADPNSLYIIWGISAMISACILAVAGLKIPQWLGFYRKSNLQLLKDTSNRAPQAVRDLTEGKLGITSFRYQARLGVDKHTTQFVFFLLPFYTDLKPYAFLVSALVGMAFGHLYLYVVFKCRQRFETKLGQVALGASVALSAISALVFAHGMYFIDSVWEWNLTDHHWALSLASWLGWLAFLLLLQTIQYFEQRKLATMDGEAGENELDDDAHLFIEGDDASSEMSLRRASTEIESEMPADEDDAGEEERLGGMEASTTTDGLEEPLMGSENQSRRNRYQKESMDAMEQNYFYQTGYFDRVTLIGKRSKKGPAQLLEAMSSATSGGIEDTSPREIYDAFAFLEQSSLDMKWYHRLWNFLPFKPATNILTHSCSNTWSCCRKKSSFHEQTCCFKIWHAIVKFSKITLNLLAIYVSLVACAATIQIRTTKRKLPYVRQVLYAGQNEGPVCAFDEKCGDIRDFSGKEEAHLANYSVAHCGACGHCSTWNDLELQYSTRHDLAEMAQECGIKTMFQGIDGLQKCLETDIGWTSECARCWAEDIYCTKRWCIFIYLQSRMTNELGNFEVSPDTITSATCEEANCEAGNPGHFVQCSGSNRRRMNITSDIARPEEEQCQVVDVPDWGNFFNPTC